MEDLAISPWENTQPTTQINLFEFRQKTASKLQKPLPLKTRYVHTQSSQQSPSPVRKQTIILNSIQKKKSSASTYQNFYNQPQIKRPSKLQLKLVAFPIQQNCKQRQTGDRLSEKFEAKSKFLNQSFEVIETIFNSELKLVRVFKQRPVTKNYTLNQNILLKKTQNKNNLRASESLDRVKFYIRDNHENTDPKSTKVMRYKDQQLRFLAQNRQRMQKLQQLPKKQTLGALKTNKNQNLRLHNLDLPELNQLNRTLDQRKMYQTNSNDSWKQQREKSKKLKDRQKKLSIQKLQNINCFRETTNIFTKLQKKNKVLFNELEKYNLFGLKSLKNKSIMK